MPIFEFRCAECGLEFEKLVMSSEDKMDMACPGCRGENLERVVSRTHHTMGGANEQGGRARLTSKDCGSSNQCATLELPGYSKD